MKIIVLTLLALLACSQALATGTHYRKGHMRQDGAYVQPSYATNPNNTKRDNYSQGGNINPYTGKKGKKK